MFYINHRYEAVPPSRVGGKMLWRMMSRNLDDSDHFVSTISSEPIDDKPQRELLQLRHAAILYMQRGIITDAGQQHLDARAAEKKKKLEGDEST